MVLNAIGLQNITSTRFQKFVSIVQQLTPLSTVGGVSAAVSKTAAAPIERVKLLIQNQVCLIFIFSANFWLAIYLG